MVWKAVRSGLPDRLANAPARIAARLELRENLLSLQVYQYIII
jgi:hypothetical protein